MPDIQQEILFELIASVAIALIFVVFIIIIFQLSRKNKILQQKQLESLKTAYEKELLVTKVEIQEDVMKQISMEIHDNIGQVLLLTNVNMTILQAMPLPSDGTQIIAETKQLVSTVIEDISALSRSLHSDRISGMGVFKAIAYELELLAKKGIFSITIQNELLEETPPLPKDSQLLLFRIYQEISKNIIKHAKATHVDFLVSETAGGIEMEIRDNGIGFMPPDLENGVSTSNGVGLRSLQSRVNLFKGNIRISSVLQKGTSIIIFIPTPDTIPA